MLPSCVRVLGRKRLCIGVKNKSLAIVVLMLTSIVANIDSNPISKEHKGKYWWHQPCASRKIRHARELPHNVRNQINFTYHTMQKIFNEHKNAVHINISGSLPHLRTNTTLKLKKMHMYLQYYAATIHNINESGVKSDIKCNIEKKPFEDIRKTLKTLLCEIDTAMTVRTNKIKPKKYVYPHEVQTFDTKIDCTTALMYRSSIIKSFTKLLEDMNKKFKRRRNQNRSRSRSRNSSNNSSSSSTSSQQG